MTQAQDDIAMWADRYGGWFVEHALPMWAQAGMDREHGGAYELIAMDGHACAVSKRARVQARQTFVYAAAHAAGHAGPWLEAADHAWRFFTQRYQRPDGLYRTRVTAEGAPDDEEAFLYDQAFAIMAAATLYKADPSRTDARDAAEALRGRLYALMRGPSGRGFKEAGGYPYQSNAHMHLFESSLAWIEAGGGPEWRALAEELAALALEKFIDADGGFLREFFDADWNPAPGADGTHVEPGHQFEWTWLLTRWSRLTGSEAAARAATRLYANGLKGIDPKHDVAVNVVNAPDMSVRDGGARLWNQTEAIKAGLILAEHAPPEEADAMRAHSAAVAAALWTYLDVETKGLWHDKLAPDGSFKDEPAPASSFYHITLAIFGLQAAAGR